MPVSDPLGAESVAHDYLFNFSASFLGGGYKRLYAYAGWFDSHGGASFIIHPQSAGLAAEFPRNRYYRAGRRRHHRILNDWRYVEEIVAGSCTPELYYSYGIPVYRKFGRINWFHLSNVLPMRSRGIPMSLFDRIRVGFLGLQIRRNFGNADVISGESLNTLGTFPASQREKLFLSVNGSDDEIGHFRDVRPAPKVPIATVIGTYSYKALIDSLRVFEMLKRREPALTMVIIGDRKFIPEEILGRNDVDAMGLLPRGEVIGYLTRSRYYISTTLIENSYNAASEGMVFADESFISDIGPHRELLESMPFDEISVNGVLKPILHVKRVDVLIDGLKSWDTVIAEMLAHAAGRLGRAAVAAE